MANKGRVPKGGGHKSLSVSRKTTTNKNNQQLNELDANLENGYLSYSTTTENNINNQGTTINNNTLISNKNNNTIDLDQY